MKKWNHLYVLFQQMILNLKNKLYNILLITALCLLGKTDMKLLRSLLTSFFFSFLPFSFSHSISVFPIAWPFCLFSPISTRPYENSQLELKSYRYFRAKLKNVSWSGDLKASLSYSSEKLIYKSTYHASKEISEFSYLLE